MNNFQILIYQSLTDNIKTDARLENETVWLTQKAILGVNIPAISKHLSNIYESEELE